MESILAPSPEQSAVAVLLIGFVFGLYHAIEADHLAAVSAIISEHKNVWTASIVGGLLFVAAFGAGPLSVDNRR